jgi:hypothetical protein
MAGVNAGRVVACALPVVAELGRGADFYTVAIELLTLGASR